MIRFQKRNIGIWWDSDGEVDYTPIEFESENDLFKFLEMELPYASEKYPLYISGHQVIRGYIIGFLVDKDGNLI